MSKPASLKLYTYKDNMRVKKIQIAAEYCGVKLEYPPFEMGKDNEDAEFLRKNPLGKVPVLETPQGCVFESNAIARYVCRLNPKAQLLGRDELQASQIDQWIDFCCNEIEPSLLGWLGPILGYIPYSEQLHQQSVEGIKTALKALNTHLERTTFLVGERLSLADIVVASMLAPLYQRVLDPRFRLPFYHTNRWFETVSMQETFSSVLKLDPTSWCTVAQKAKAPAAEKSKVVQPPKEEKPKEEKPKQEKQQKPKEEKKAEKEEKKPKEDKKKKKDEDEDEEEDEEAKEEKKPDPLALLPKSTFVLDAYKREYSNKKIDESTDFLWANYDPAGYTMFFCKYKYNEECTVTFRSTNLIGGFFQRLEKMHKYAFGVMLIHGADNAHEISGYWIFRGQGVPQHMVEDVADTELYDWTPIDFAQIDAHKARIKSYLNWEAIDGKECLDGKCFK